MSPERGNKGPRAKCAPRRHFHACLGMLTALPPSKGSTLSREKPPWCSGRRASTTSSLLIHSTNTERPLLCQALCWADEQQAPNPHGLGDGCINGGCQAFTRWEAAWSTQGQGSLLTSGVREGSREGGFCVAGSQQGAGRVHAELRERAGGSREPGQVPAAG